MDAKVIRETKNALKINQQGIHRCINKGVRGVKERVGRNTKSFPCISCAF